MPRGVKKKTVAAKGVKRWASNKAPAPNLDIKGESVLPLRVKYMSKLISRTETRSFPN